MKKLTVFPLCLGCVLASATSHAIDLKQSKLTQVVNDVQIISAADQKQKVATVNDVFAMPDVLRTGASSRAELVAPDETVTRVGANTIFSFDPANRTIDLKQGSLLFHSPHGKGGGSIHTGSATASVLGTTLIVVTTKNGGLKVIALEGHVEVKFLNGLKQKLDPGQMTYILPGANQLAPVIIFRLDELTQNSLLVKGFTQTLESLPLIQDQVIHQLKWIASGKATDTGLYAGDGASPNQVEVLDLNTIPHGQVAAPQSQQTPPPNIPPNKPPLVPNLGSAEAGDATINQPSLTDASIPTPADHIYTVAPFALKDNDFFGSQTFSGFVARNINVNTIGLTPLIVDLTPYVSMETFDMVAVDVFSIKGSVMFKGLSNADTLALIAGSEFDLASGIMLRADVKNFLLSSRGELTFDNVSLYNNFKDVTLNSGDNIVIQNNSLISSAARLIINAIGNISATDSHLIGNSALFTSLTGVISLDNTILDAPDHTIFIAPTSISLNNSTINSDFVVINGTTAASVAIDRSTINASSSIVINSVYDLNITDSESEPNAKIPHALDLGTQLNVDPGSGTVDLSSMFGSVNVSGTSITAHYLTLSSGDGILLDGSGHSLNATGSGATANLTASFSPGGLIDVRNVDFTPFAAVNMAANTINLCYVNFGDGSSVTLKSLYGVLAPDPNTGATSVPGDVNFIRGVTYGGDPAQNHIGSGIVVTTLH